MTSFLKQVFRRIKFYDLPGIKDHHPEEWTRENKCYLLSRINSAADKGGRCERLATLHLNHSRAEGIISCCLSVFEELGRMVRCNELTDRFQTKRLFMTIHH